MARRRTRARRRSTTRSGGVPGFIKVLLLGGLVLGLYIGARLMMAWEAPNSEDSSRVSFTVERGMTVSQIGEALAAAELVKDPWVFGLYVQWNKLTQQLQAGDYVLQKNLTLEELTAILGHGIGDEMKVTIPEGSTVQDIDGILARLSLIEPGEFVRCANTCVLSFEVDNVEGYLFPSTYFVPAGEAFDARAFLERLHDNQELIRNEYATEVAQSGRTWGQIVNVASMVEREANNAEEMPIVAGIIWKRLDEGMHLGIDATTRYEKNDWKGPLYAADFAKNTPYNTRLRLGLPPTAISNPGRDALVASIVPEVTEYYYYLHAPNGKIHYGRTLAEHNENKRLYLR